MIKSFLNNNLKQDQAQDQDVFLISQDQQQQINESSVPNINIPQNIQHQIQSLIASTFIQINQLENDVISELASQYQDQISLIFNKQDIIQEQSQYKENQFSQFDQNQIKLFKELSLTLHILKEVKFKLVLLLEIDLQQKKTILNYKQISQNIIQFQKIIMLLESQLSMIQYIQKNQFNLHFKQKYYEKFALSLQSFSIDLNQLFKTQKSKFSSRYNKPQILNKKNYNNFQISKFSNQIDENKRSKDKDNSNLLNIKTILQSQQTLRNILQQYSQSITAFQQLIVSQKRQKYINRGMNILKVINAKITTISEVLPYCCTVDKNDLFSFQQSNPRWRKLILQSITYRTYASKQILKQSFQQLKKNLNLINCTMGILDKTRKIRSFNIYSWINILRSTQYLIKCFIFKDAAKKQAQFMISSANTQLMKEVWNLPEHKIFRDFAEFVLPPIQHSQRLYIPRIYKQFFNSNGQLKFPQTKILFLNQYGNQLFRKKNYNESLRIRINAKYHLKQKFHIIDQNIKKQSQGKGYLMRNLENLCNNFNIICQFNKKNISVPQKIIFHIHGGGFISMSSFIHQVYTRNWANQLQIPIISVDYGKAPEHPYPESLYDCLEAYLWILYSFEQVYQIKPKKIVFLGDSAGGNLAAALINLLIAWKLRIPDGLIMCYPVLSVTTKKYTKSLLGTLQDMILPHTLLKLCQQSYAKNRQFEYDPLISPLYTPNQYLKKYPQTRIFVGSKDPFHDDCCRFTQKLNSINPGKCYLTIFEQFPHGFLQFDVRTHPHQFSKKANKEICQAIRNIFD